MSKSEYSRKVEAAFYKWLGDRRFSSDSDYFNGLEVGFSAGYECGQEARSQSLSSEPDIYEVLLIGGGNDGKRIAVHKELLNRWIYRGTPLEVPYSPDSEVVDLDFDSMTANISKCRRYCIEYYYPCQLFGHLTVARYYKLPLDRMYFQLVRKYRCNLEQTT